MAEKRNGAGSRLAGLLERPTPPDQPAEPDGPESDDGVGGADPISSEPSRGRGSAPKKPRAADPRAAKKIKGRTIYLPDDLFERIIVQAHRRDKTISEYVTAILERQVPDHRVIRAETTDAGAA
jgi:hypothetical protein